MSPIAPGTFTASLQTVLCQLLCFRYNYPHELDLFYEFPLLPVEQVVLKLLLSAGFVAELNTNDYYILLTEKFLCFY